MPADLFKNFSDRLQDFLETLVADADEQVGDDIVQLNAQFFLIPTATGKQQDQLHAKVISATHERPTEWHRRLCGLARFERIPSS